MLMFNNNNKPKTKLLYCSIQINHKKANGVFEYLFENIFSVTHGLQTHTHCYIFPKTPTDIIYYYYYYYRASQYLYNISMKLINPE